MGTRTAHPDLDDEDEPLGLCHEIEFEGSDANVSPQNSEALLDEESGGEVLGASANGGSTHGHGSAAIDRCRRPVA